MTLIAEVFRKLRTPQNMVRSISKRSRSKRSFGKQHGKWAKTLLKFECQYFYHIYSSLGTRLTCKTSRWVICKISKLFPNTQSADGKYSLPNIDNLTQHIHMQLSKKPKTFSGFFFRYLKSSLNFAHFQNEMTVIAGVFRNYGLHKTWLYQFLKGLVSRDPSESNRVNGSNFCWNLNGSTFTIFIDHCERRWLAKSPC